MESDIKNITFQISYTPLQAGKEQDAAEQDAVLQDAMEQAVEHDEFNDLRLAFFER